MANERIEVPLWKRFLLTVEETSSLTGIGRNRLYELSLNEAEDCVVWVGSRRLFKRRKFEEFLMNVSSL